MRKRFTQQEKFNMIMECRNSGLSDYMWCKQNDIPISTFYYWISQLRKAGSELPPSGSDSGSQSFVEKPDIVRLEIVDESTKQAVSCESYAPIADTSGIEILFGKACIKIHNDVSPALLSQVMSCLGGSL